MVEVELGQASAYSVKQQTDGLGHGWLGAAFRLYSVNFIFYQLMTRFDMENTQITINFVKKNIISLTLIT